MHVLKISKEKFVFSIFVVIIALPFILTFLGYSLNGVGWVVAQKAARKGDVDVCRKILVIFNPFGLSPSATEQRADCIHEYAKITKDPTACESLLPSSYGWSCLGVATDSNPCFFDIGPAREIRGQGKITTYDQCLSGSPDIRNHSCCIMARIAFDLSNNDDCSLFQTDELKDQCHYEKSRKNKNLIECGEMKNERNRVGCEVGIRALLKQ